MATAEQVIALPRLRQSIGIVGDDQDTMLTAYRNTAIAVVEKYIGRHIIDRTGYRTEPNDFGYNTMPDYLSFYVPDVKANPDGDDIVLHYRPWDDDPIGQTNQTMPFEISNERVGLIGGGRDGILLYSAPSASWDSILRMTYPAPYIVVNTGMDSNDVPAAWGDAVALIVRALLDGSAYDDLGKMSVLDVALGPWKINAYMGSIR